MSSLRLDLTQRTFADLLDLGRALIPRYAPQWTDHNVHDPGITLLELLAWNTEAQIYSLGRMRRDERIAYAALMGVEPLGPAPARGIIWPNLPTPQHPVPSWGSGVIIEKGAEARTPTPDTPIFRTTQRILLAGAELTSIRTYLADGSVIDHTAANRRGGAAFLPFGPDASPKDRLILEFQLADSVPLVPPSIPTNDLNSTQKRELCLSLGIRAAAPAVAVPPAARAKLVAHLVVGQVRYPRTIVEDSSSAFAETGVLLVDIADLPVITGTFTIELAPMLGGIARAPRVLRIEPNVLPIIQNEDRTSEPHEVTGVVGQVITLDMPGLRYGAGAPPVEVLVLEAGDYRPWRLEKDLSMSGPEESVYVLDTDRAEIRFGNGVNGRLPPPGNVLVNYSVCDGAAGNLPRNQSWMCRGIADVFGKNLDATTGGADSMDLARMRHEARERLQREHALVTSDDLIAAALDLPLLDVVRAHVVEKDLNSPRMAALPGSRTLVLLRARTGTASEADEVHESPRWLAAARRSLSARLPLGERLRVIAPNYVRLRISARLRLERMASPTAVSAAARQELAKRLSLVPADDRTVWPFGREVTAVQVAAWLSKIDGVAKIEMCSLYREDDDKASDIIAITGNDLPSLDLERTNIEVLRAQRGT